MILCESDTNLSAGRECFPVVEAHMIMVFDKKIVMMSIRDKMAEGLMQMWYFVVMVRLFSDMRRLSGSFFRFENTACDHIKLW